MSELWVDKHSPKTLDEFVWPNPILRTKVERWVKQGTIDNVLLLGPPGVGKTTFAHLVLHALDVDQSDILVIPASKKNSIDIIRGEVSAFIQTGGHGLMKYVILDEADYLSQNAMGALRGDMTEYSDVVRWILTGNLENRIMDAIKDRCVEIDLGSPSVDSILLRIIAILDKENIPITTDQEILALKRIVDKHYPSIRKCIRTLQDVVLDGKIDFNALLNLNDWTNDLVKLLQKKDISAARDLILKNTDKSMIPDVYRILYKHAGSFGDKDQAILAIAEGVRFHGLAADTEINLAATLVRLTSL